MLDNDYKEISEFDREYLLIKNKADELLFNFDADVINSDNFDSSLKEILSPYDDNERLLLLLEMSFQLLLELDGDDKILAENLYKTTLISLRNPSDEVYNIIARHFLSLNDTSLLRTISRKVTENQRLELYSLRMRHRMASLDSNLFKFLLNSSSLDFLVYFSLEFLFFVLRENYPENELKIIKKPENQLKKEPDFEEKLLTKQKLEIKTEEIESKSEENDADNENEEPVTRKTLKNNDFIDFCRMISLTFNFSGDSEVKCFSKQSAAMWTVVLVESLIDMPKDDRVAFIAEVMFMIATELRIGIVLPILYTLKALKPVQIIKPNPRGFIPADQIALDNPESKLSNEDVKLFMDLIDKSSKGVLSVQDFNNLPEEDEADYSASSDYSEDIIESE